MLFVLLFEIVSSAAGSPVIPMLGIVVLTAAEIPMLLTMKESELLRRKTEAGADE